MPLSSTAITAKVSIAFPSLPTPKIFKSGNFPMKNDGSIGHPRVTAFMASRSLKFVANSLSGDSSVSVDVDVPFPSDYSELLDQARNAAELALKDNRQLMEIEVPTAGLESVPGDGEGGIEMTGSMQLIREFCDRFINPEKATRTRIFFPEASEVKFARESAFGGASFKLDYLTKPSFFEDFGFFEKVKMADRVQLEDELFLVAYPYFNVNEMLVVEELYKEAVENTARKLIIFNGELDRIRSGWVRKSEKQVGPSAGLYSAVFALLRQKLLLDETLLLLIAGQTFQDPPAHDVDFMLLSAGLYGAFCHSFKTPIILERIKIIHLSSTRSWPNFPRPSCL